MFSFQNLVSIPILIPFSCASIIALACKIDEETWLPETIGIQINEASTPHPGALVTALERDRHADRWVHKERKKEFIF